MPGRDEAPDLAIVHLSDIHFREGRTDDAHDPDRDLRNELLKDLRIVRADLDRIDAIVVTGDVAFAGKAGEYVFARAWLEAVREQLECPKDAVLVTPGNHDIDRDLIAADVDRMHQEIRACESIEAADAALAGILRDGPRSARLLDPMASYNKFAGDFKCDVTARQPYWERDFPLGDNTVLRIRGLSTTLISGPKDNERAHKLIYGAAQRQVLRSQNVRYVVAGHHPPSTTLDGEDAERAFAERTCLQLFGHKHDQWIAAHGDSLRLVAGALHPARNERQWLPRYNVLTIRARLHNRAHVVEVRVYPRRWSTEEMTFIPDYNSQRHDYRLHRLRVTPPETNAIPAANHSPPPNAVS